MPEQNLIRNTVCNWAFLELSARVSLLTCPTPLMLTLCGTDRSSAATSCRRRRATRRATSSTPTSWWTYARLAARRSSANQNTSTTINVIRLTSLAGSGAPVLTWVTGARANERLASITTQTDQTRRGDASDVRASESRKRNSKTSHDSRAASGGNQKQQNI